MNGDYILIAQDENDIGAMATSPAEVSRLAAIDAIVSITQSVNKYVNGSINGTTKEESSVVKKMERTIWRLKQTFIPAVDAEDLRVAMDTYPVSANTIHTTTQSHRNRYKEQTIGIAASTAVAGSLLGGVFGACVCADPLLCVFSTASYI